MRWFKHLATAHHDEKLSRLLDEFGAEGYGIFWLILEHIALQVDENKRAEVTYSDKKWRKILGITPKKLEIFITFALKIELFSIKVEENLEKNHQNFKDKLITIECPKLLKYRDEWTKKKEKKMDENSGVTPERLRSKDIEIDTDTEIYKKKNREKEKSLALPPMQEMTVAKPPKRRYRQQTFIDPNFQVSPAVAAYAKQHNTADPYQQLPRFINYYVAKGESRADWDATFRTWLIRSKNYEDNGNGKPKNNMQKLQQYIRDSRAAYGSSENSLLNFRPEEPEPEFDTYEQAN